jgi:carbonic anhydrase
MFELIYRYDPAVHVLRELPGDAKEALTRLEEGNRLFSSLASNDGETSRVVYMDLADLGLDVSGGVPAQEPFAVVLGCADARVPPEMIFNRTCNELFVVRVAGNIISEELLGSIDYAVEHLGENLKLIAVLGHSQCGAVTAAVDAFLAPAEYLSFAAAHHLRAIINILFPAVRGAVRALSLKWGDEVANSPGYRAALIESAVVINAALTASILKSEFDSETTNRRFVFGMYDLSTRRVHVPQLVDGEGEPTIRLLDAPKGLEEFRRFASEVVSSRRISRLLSNTHLEQH